jgi:hypothetical protein
MEKSHKPVEQKEYVVTEHGSLGLLALGHIGIRLWKKAVQEAKNKKTENPPQ